MFIRLLVPAQESDWFLGHADYVTQELMVKGTVFGACVFVSRVSFVS